MVQGSTQVYSESESENTFQDTIWTLFGPTKLTKGWSPRPLMSCFLPRGFGYPPPCVCVCVLVPSLNQCNSCSLPHPLSPLCKCLNSLHSSDQILKSPPPCTLTFTTLPMAPPSVLLGSKSLITNWLSCTNVCYPLTLSCQWRVCDKGFLWLCDVSFHHRMMSGPQ